MFVNLEIPVADSSSSVVQVREDGRTRHRLQLKTDTGLSLRLQHSTYTADLLHEESQIPQARRIKASRVEFPIFRRHPTPNITNSSLV
jgi:hypothetical protein